jgi:phosphoenolpyruvate carboxykinase (ATP)
VETVEDTTFHIRIPALSRCASELLFPKNTWADKGAYDTRAKKLANDFCAHFDKAYGTKNIDTAVAAQCPGK